MIETQCRPYEEYYTFLQPALVPDRRIRAIRRYIESQYAKFDRYYHNLKYLERVLQQLDHIIQAQETMAPGTYSDEDNQDLFTAALFHRIFMTNRAVDNAHTIGFLTKKHLDQEYYPRSQRVCTLVEQSDFIHFPPGRSHGILSDTLRDAVACEVLLHPDTDHERRMAYFRRDLGWDWNALVLHYSPVLMAAADGDLLQTQGARAQFKKSLAATAGKSITALKKRARADTDVA